MRGGVGAHIREAGGIFDARELPRVGVGPAAALLEFDGMVVEQQVHRDGWHQRRLVVRGP
jgi:hypothetical protein